VCSECNLRGCGVGSDSQAHPMATGLGQATWQGGNLMVSVVVLRIQGPLPQNRMTPKKARSGGGRGKR
jgi:hypothetical protein